MLDPYSTSRVSHTSRRWIVYPAVPPPLNLLSVPYAAYVACTALPSCAGWLRGCMRTCRRVPMPSHAANAPHAATARRSVARLTLSGGRLSAAHRPEYQLPQQWIYDVCHDEETDEAGDAKGVLAGLIFDFVNNHSEDVTREDRWRSEMMREMRNRFHTLHLELLDQVHGQREQRAPGGIAAPTTGDAQHRSSEAPHEATRKVGLEETSLPGSVARSMAVKGKVIGLLRELPPDELESVLQEAGRWLPPPASSPPSPPSPPLSDSVEMEAAAGRTFDRIRAVREVGLTV
jgi:hypothetical protein